MPEYNSIRYFDVHIVPASRNEYYTIKQQLEVETFPGENPTDPSRVFHELQPVEQASKEKKRLAGQGLIIMEVVARKQRPYLV